MTALDEIRAIYDEIPEVDCKGRCANSCGPIDMSTVERRRLTELGVEIPMFTPERAQRWANQERLDCPALTPLRTCRVYQDRPLICRLWGVAESMPCVWGCKPKRLLTDDEAYDLIFRVIEIGGHPLYDLSAGKMRRAMKEFQEDPELGPLLARYIRGEKNLEDEIVRLVDERRRA